MYAIVTGDPFDGMDIFGPFDSEGDATAWAETELAREVWWAVEIKEP